MEQKSCDDAKIAAAILSACVTLLLSGISAAIVWHSRRANPVGSKQDAVELLQRFRLDSNSDDSETEEHHESVGGVDVATDQLGG